MTDNHPYEQRITGDGDNWGEIMADAFDGLMASASESCTAEELDALESHIAATLGGGECEFNVVEEFIPGKRQRANICECSNCGYRCAYGFIMDEGFKYCPRCGAKVRKAAGA